MKERPIIFNSEMVRAILEGRKTQTRRPMKHQPPKEGMRFSTIVCSSNLKQEGKHDWVRLAEDGYTIKERSGVYFSSPHGKPGDRLWVRETHFVQCAGYTDGSGKDIIYKADDPGWPYGWIPSIHMPRWASRITLEITNVRVERVQDISEEDAEAEGCRGNESGPWGREGLMEDFETLWDSIYQAKGLGWDTNPFVWVYEFRRVE